MFRSRWRHAAIAAAAAAFGAAGILAAPLAPRFVPGPVPIHVRLIAVDVRETAVAELPFAASDVSVHWTGSPDARVSVQLATQPGAFGEAIRLGPDETGLGGPGRDEDLESQPGTAHESASRASGASPAAAVNFSDVIWAAGARWIRLTSNRPLGTATVVAYQTDGAPTVRPATDEGPVVDAAVGAPPIITRAQWGADESLRFDYANHEKWPPSYFPLQVFIVHHTDGRNDDPNPAATMRAIYYDDAIIRDWGDFGYNFAIDSAGHIYEGRHARNYASGEPHDGEDLSGKVARGAHAKGYNSGSLGIVLLGTFDSVQPTAAARASLEKLLAWEAGRHGVNPTTASQYTNPDLGTTKFLNHISGHRDVNATDCPGAAFYPTFPELRTAVKNRISATLGPVDTTPPAVDTFRPLATDPTGGTSIDFGLVFTEPVTGLTAADFSVGGTSTGWAVSKVTGIGSGYTVTVSATTPTPGSIELDLAADAVTDGGSHTGPASPGAATANYAVDTTAPTVGITFTPHTSATSKTSLDGAVTFSEPVEGLTAADIHVAGTSNAATAWVVDPVVGSGAHYGFTIERPDAADGTLTISIPAGATTDPAGNPNGASGIHMVIIDRTAPKTSAPTPRLRSQVALSTTVPASLTWTGTDGSVGSGIATYDVARSVDGSSFTTIATGVVAASLAASLSSGHAYRYEVRARDRAGNVGAWVAGPTVKPILLQQTSSAIAYHGTWTSLSSTSYSGGSVRYATVAGASASLTTSARGLAFVTARGPTRGAVKVYVDGVLKATIDLYAATSQPRYVAYSVSWSTVATHSINIVLVGTAGRPRVDLDAFEVLR